MKKDNTTTELINMMADEEENEEEDETEVTTYHNSIAHIITIISWIIIIVGVIAGFVMGANNGTDMDEFSFSTAFTVWVKTIASGIVFLGFAEIIKLLDSINQKLK